MCLIYSYSSPLNGSKIQTAMLWHCWRPMATDGTLALWRWPTYVTQHWMDEISSNLLIMHAT